jgi:CRISPR-associated endoribonuclease Cas6
LLAQAIKGLILAGGDKSFFDYTHYNFSGLKGQTKVSRKGLHFYSAKVTLVFSAADRSFLDYFAGVLLTGKDIFIGGLHLLPEAVESENPATISESVKFLCISPIVLLPAAFNDENSKRFVPPESDEFSDLLYDATIARMAASGKFSAVELAEYYKFQIVADYDYINRLQNSHKKFARIYPLFDSDIKYEVRGYTFPFTLYAPQPVQQFVYESGLGHFSHKGFGMLDVADSDLTTREADKELTYA